MAIGGGWVWRDLMVCTSDSGSIISLAATGPVRCSEADTRTALPLLPAKESLR